MQSSKTHPNSRTKSHPKRPQPAPPVKKVGHGLGARPGSELVQVVWCEGVQGGRLGQFDNHPSKIDRAAEYPLSAVGTEIDISKC